MGDIKRAFENAGIKSSSTQKKCKCGRTIKNSKFDTCYECSQKKYGGEANLPDGYLSNGYFKERDVLHEELVGKMADSVARSFRNLTNHQLRRFYTHVRDAENKLKMTKDWQSVNIDIKKLKAFIAEAFGKKKIPETFYHFINKNLDCVKDEISFVKGFLIHFEAVVAYFTFYNPKK